MTTGDDQRRRARDEQRAAVDELEFRSVLGCFASGVTVVTAMDDGNPVGFTCQAFTSLSLDPPMVALAPAKRSTSWPRIARAGSFCVNILAQDQALISEVFSMTDIDKFENVAWHPGTLGAPILDGALAYVECELGIIHDAGDHELVTGRVLSLGVGTGHPLVFFRGDYGTFSFGEAEGNDLDCS